MQYLPPVLFPTSYSGHLLLPYLTDFSIADYENGLLFTQVFSRVFISKPWKSDIFLLRRQIFIFVCVCKHSSCCRGVWGLYSTCYVFWKLYTVFSSPHLDFTSLYNLNLEIWMKTILFSPLKTLLIKHGRKKYPAKFL